MKCNHPPKNWLRKYRRNEGENFHSDNLVLLARICGTDEEIAMAERQAKSCHPDNVPWQMPAHVRSRINSYYAELREQPVHYTAKP